MDRGDIEAILGFIPELYESNFPEFRTDGAFIARKRAQLKEAQHDPAQMVFVATDEQGVCGFVWLMVEIEWSGQRRGEVSAIHVARRVRGTGVGKALMDEALNFFRVNSCASVHLMVTASNEAAVGLYRNMGFAVTRYQMEKQL